MKIYVVLIFMLYGIISILNAVEIDGFRNLKWGSSSSLILNKVDMSSASNASNKISVYMSNDENLKIGDVDLRSIWYYYYNDKLYQVFVSFGGYSNFLTVKNVLEAKFRKGSQTDILGYEYSWESKNGMIDLDYNSIEETGSMFLFGIKIFNEAKSYERKMSKKAIHDI